MNKAFRIVCLFFLLSFMLRAQQKEILCVVPEPGDYTFSDEKFSVKEGTIQLRQFCRQYEQINLAVDELCLLLQRKLNIQVSNQKYPKRKILIGIPHEDESFKALCRKYKILPESLAEEGYCLLIKNDSILISASSQKGLFYGLQTLKQIFRGVLNNAQFVQGISISDFPDYKYRAVMDDISRGPVPKMEYMKYQIRRLSEMKVNMLMYYVEHVVKTKSHPEFAPADGALSIEDWNEISEYALKYNITLAGNFQSFGHFNNILSTPEYANLGECGTLISPVNPDSYRFLEDIYTEMVPSFKAPFFNINCDETFDLGKGASKKMVDSIGYAETYYTHIMRLHEILKKLKTKVMIWGDVALEHRELLTKLPKDIIIAAWNYDHLSSYSSLIEPVKEAGFRFFVAPGILNSNRLYPNFDQAFANIKGFLKSGRQSGAMGELTTVWDDGGCALFSNDWYGVAYSADKAWNISSRDSAGFDLRFNRGLHGSGNNMYTEALNMLCRLGSFEATDAMNDRILFEKLLPDSGKTVHIPRSDWQKVYALCDSALLLLKGCSPDDYAMDVEYLSFSIRLFKTLAQERLSLLKAVDYYSMALVTAKLNPSGAERILLETIDLADGLIKRELFLKENYEKLWLKENRKYSLSGISEKFMRKIEDYTDLKDRLNMTIGLLENSSPLPDGKKLRLGIIPTEGKYLREWLIINPFKSKDNLKPSKVDYLAGAGGELKLIPKVTEEIYSDSSKHRWSRVISGCQDLVDLSEIFGGSIGQAVTYAFATIEAPEDTTVNCLLSCSGTVDVILNGKKVFTVNTPAPDEKPSFLQFKKGVNNLMLKISSTAEVWNFSFRITGFELRNRKNRYRILLSKI